MQAGTVIQQVDGKRVDCTWELTLLRCWKLESTQKRVGVNMRRDCLFVAACCTISMHLEEAPFIL